MVLVFVTRTQAFVYDELDRLIQASSGSSGNGDYGVESYSYDAASNRRTKINANGTETYNYNATSNRLSTITQNSAITRQFTYDGAGNIISDAPSSGDLLTLDYNNAGRYAQLDKNTQPNTIYKYNAMGERVIKYLLPQQVPAMALTDAFPVLAPLLAALSPEEQESVTVAFGGTQESSVNWPYFDYSADRRGNALPL